MSLIILRECNIGILSGDYDLWLDTISEVSLNNTIARTLLSKRNLFNNSNAQAVIHKNNDTTTDEENNETETLIIDGDFIDFWQLNLIGKR